MEQNPPIFPSFVLAGYECSYARPHDKDRMDILAATLHDVRCSDDYDLLKPLGIRGVREGLSWSQIDQGAGKYDFSRFEEMMRIAQAAGITQIWNLNHFDIPEDLDIFSEEFITRFRAYAVECVRLIRTYQSGTIFIAPINEISFYTYMAGVFGHWHPFIMQRGLSFKKRLVEASIAAMAAIRAIDMDVRFILIDPVMRRVVRDPHNAVTHTMQESFAEERFQMFDLISGRLHPELGGKPEYLDILGINIYPSSQEWIVGEDFGDTASFETIDYMSTSWQPLHELLREVQMRYDRPMIISETGAWGALRPSWWKTFLHQADEAIAAGLKLHAICAYPVIDRPDWGDGHLTNSGLWDFRGNDPGMVRMPQTEIIQIISEFSHRHA